MTEIRRRDFVQKLAGVTVAGCLTRTGLAQATIATGEGLIPIIDTHQHLWDLDRLNVPWVHNAAEVLRRSYVTRDYLKATKGLNVAKTIYMEVNVPLDQQVKEVELVTKLCDSDEHPTVAAVIGGHPNDPTFADYIRKMAKNRFVKGVRQVLHGGSPRGFCLSDRFVQSIQLLGDLGLSFDLCMRPKELSDGVKLVDKCPQTQFIVDHCGNVDPKQFPLGVQVTQDAGIWQRDMAALAGRKNVACKISGIVARAPQPNWSAQDLAPVVNYCLEQFGPDRVVFGSDWPVCLVGAPLARWVTALRQIIQTRPAEQQRKLLYQNAQKIYRV